MSMKYANRLIFAYCTCTVGLTVYGLRGINVLLTGAAQSVNFTVSAALLFGTICAAVDPVAVS